MKVGILSDTHGNLPIVGGTAQKLKDEKVRAVFHCGDIGGFDVLTKLASVFQPLDIPVYAVLGNVDTYSNEWKFLPSNQGIHVLGRFGEIDISGKKIALLHSDDARRFSEAVNSGSYDYIFTGHSHAVHDYKEGSTRCINPGTAGRGAPDTCAVLDLKRDKLTIIEI
jgi:putative phosphoesterase